ncbi:SDR family NAD(P)-dependent oxidoreductase [Paraburkholderia saeva]|uniref:SDR family NAD(P)-dependent oxidoreductase n=1 Tax=Paraburkholderia saeva TaxID=2777537 RepID=UPI001E05705E|nr:SDR family NAD(P)-dependent oxidoreductase [Paraburkholderia saeva]CAG4886698.1 3-phenylpropionate-dihydrodiol/cinnamic acid-dihydrodiol dehydrogenase [Paraburkholderia saeva]CAG4899268.1 3-phenylpropionate-dihydrodiol/cinnamic acid-dihydrodiol dehydrogenase [Paraburkholderia saeva]
MTKVWLVTGSARGLGREIVEAALAAGERVVATARNPAHLDTLVERYGDRVRVAALDVTDSGAALDAVQLAVDAFGRLDVVVNNAGFGHLAPFEQAPEADFRAQIDTNFYGVVNVTRAALPVMRQQRAGHIIQISSVGGRVGIAGLAAYQAAKWAVGGFTEVISQEVAPFGVKVTALEPGGMKTGWGGEALSALPDLLPDYAPSVGQTIDLLGQHVGQETSDPAKVAALVLRLAAHDTLPPHLLLGSDALYFCGDGDKARAASAALWHDVSLSTDFAAAGLPPALPAA